MKRFTICILTALCLFTASAVSSLACATEKDGCGITQEHSAKQSNEQHKDVGSHSCCHAHTLAAKPDKLALNQPISILNNYNIIQQELITQFQPGILLEPPSHA